MESTAALPEEDGPDIGTRGICDTCGENAEAQTGTYALFFSVSKTLPDAKTRQWGLRWNLKRITRICAGRPARWSRSCGGFESRYLTSDRVRLIERREQQSGLAP